MRSSATRFTSTIDSAESVRRWPGKSKGVPTYKPGSLNSVMSSGAGHPPPSIESWPPDWESKPMKWSAISNGGKWPRCALMRSSAYLWPRQLEISSGLTTKSIEWRRCSSDSHTVEADSAAIGFLMVGSPKESGERSVRALTYLGLVSLGVEAVGIVLIEIESSHRVPKAGQGLLVQLCRATL